MIAVQEARVSEVGAIQQNKFLATWKQPWHAIWGRPPAPPKNKFKMPAKRAAGKTTYGGGGILARKSIPLIPIGRDSQAAQALHESTRWVSSAIPLSTHGALSRRFLHICSFYGVVNRRNDARHTQNERLLKRLFEYGTTLGQQPVLLCLDSNTTVHASLVLSQALTSKNWIDLGSYFTKDNPECTFSSAAQWDKISTGAGVTRPDLILANQYALQLCTSFQLRRDLTVKGHLGLQIEISAPKAMETIRVHVPPKAFLQLPAVGGAKAKKKKLQGDIPNSFQKHFSCHAEIFRQALSTKDLNTAWSELGKVGEAILADFSQNKGEDGRNCLPRFSSQKVAAPSASARHPTHVHNRKLTHLHKTLRLVKEHQIKQILHTQRGLSSQSWCDILPLAERIQQRCQKWHITCPNNWLSIQCESLICDLEVLINKIHKDSTIGRIRAWRSKLRESFDVHKHGAAAFAWLNSKAPSNMQAILTAEGQIATDTNEMLNSIAHSWQNLFHECDLIDINNLKLHLSPLL